MKIIERIRQKQDDLHSGRQITVAFLGDSVTQGCFDCYEASKDVIEPEFFPEKAYCEIFKKMLHKLYPSVPVTVVNAGISGGSAYGGMLRLDRDVLSYAPDLVVVCFGLNDSNNGKEGIVRYASYLKEIFRKIAESGAEIIFMTPNVLNDHVSPKLSVESLRTLAESFSDRMKSGLFDEYVAAGKKVAAECGVTVCDCYALWKKMAANGVNVTELLANKLNHPDQDMHFLFAYELIKTIMD